MITTPDQLLSRLTASGEGIKGGKERTGKAGMTGLAVKALDEEGGKLLSCLFMRPDERKERPGTLEGVLSCITFVLTGSGIDWHCWMSGSLTCSVKEMEEGAIFKNMTTTTTKHNCKK